MVAVVAGGSSEIGLEIVRTLALKGIKVVVTSRDESSGKKLVDKIRDEDGVEVGFHPVDVTSDDSVTRFAAWIEENFGAADILINNIGLLLHPTKKNLEEALPVIEVNYRGAKRLVKGMLPVMNKGGAHIVNISGLASRLDILNNAWKEKLSGIESLTEETVDQFVEEYLKDVASGEQTVDTRGWPSAFHRMDYSVSKMALNAFVRVLAKDLEASGAKIYVNCTSPGHTSSKMSGNTGHSTSMGIETAIWLAVMPQEEAFSGRYVIKKVDVGFDTIPLAHFDELIYDPGDIMAHLTERSSYCHHGKK